LHRRGYFSLSVLQDLDVSDILNNRKSKNRRMDKSIAKSEIIIPFTESEITFLNQHNINSEDVFDAQGMTVKTFRPKAKAVNADFVLAKPCKKAGHRLRTRSSGDCIQCNPARIAYQKRNAHNAEGFVYIAYSEFLGRVKVGCCWPNLTKRVQNLRGQGYGGGRDWKLVFHAKVDAMGLVEIAVQKRLAAYAVAGQNYRGGQAAVELFNCSISKAVKAVKAEI
jgi:hypothetical protein